VNFKLLSDKLKKFEAFILLGIHMYNTSLESLCIQLAKNGLIWVFCLSSSQKFKVEYTCTAKDFYLYQQTLQACMYACLYACMHYNTNL